MRCARPGGNVEGELVDEQLPVLLVGDAAQLDDAIGELGRLGDDHLDVEFLFGPLLAGELEVALHAVDGFRPPGARLAPHPFQFPFQEFLAAMLLALLHRGPLRLGEEEIVVRPVVRNEIAAGELDHARGHAIEEVAVVGHEEAGAGIVLEEIFQPLDRLGIEVIRRLIQDQQIGLRDQRAAEGDAPLFTTAERLHEAFGLRRVQIGDEGDSCLAVLGRSSPSK